MSTVERTVVHITHQTYHGPERTRCPATSEGLPFCTETLQRYDELVSGISMLDCALTSGHIGHHYDKDYDLKWTIQKEAVEQEVYDSEIAMLQRAAETDRSHDPQIVYSGDV